jgi:hypothetical protein
MAPQAVGARVTIMNLDQAPIIGATLPATKQCLMAQKCGVSHPWCSGWASKTKALCIVFLLTTLCAPPTASRWFVAQQELTDIKKAGHGPAFLVLVKRQKSHWTSTPAVR